MTLDDLMEVYNKIFTITNSHRTATLAVVEALRDYVSSKEASRLDYGVVDVRDKFNAILGVKHDDLDA
jgi:hypothetical protein